MRWIDSSILQRHLETLEVSISCCLSRENLEISEAIFGSLQTWLQVKQEGSCNLPEQVPKALQLFKYMFRSLNITSIFS